MTIHSEVIDRVNLRNNERQMVINYNSNFIIDLSDMNDGKEGIERKSWSILKKKLTNMMG